MLIFLTGFLLSALAAFAASRLAKPKQNLLLNILAVLLPLSEAWKQLLLTAGNSGSYLWWYFPFQLCSMPLYLLPLRQLLLAGQSRPRATQKMKAPKDIYSAVPDSSSGNPQVRALIIRTFTDFLADFGLLAGVFAFADQTGMQYALPVLTLHSYLWHFIMIFLGLFLHFSGSARKSVSGSAHRSAVNKPAVQRPAVNKSPANKPAANPELPAGPDSFSFGKSLKSFLPPALLFLLLSGIAELLNCLLHTRGTIDMFYINPWEPSTQVILRSIAGRFGRGPEIILYLCLILTGAGLIHVCSRFLSRRFSRSSAAKAG